ncbi:MAG TPA: HEAT repeat domain-containing protein [Dehalococcoidia bacterium]|nr:HEAT repeat domain-containing protein [Dehalococcoidia bacterium]
MTIAELLLQLSDDDIEQGESKLGEFSHLSPEELQELRRVWPEMPPERRLRLIERMAELNSSRIDFYFDDVFTLALDDDLPAIRIAAIGGLFEHEGRDIIGPLIRALREDDDLGVRAASALALGRFAELAEANRLRMADAKAVEVALADAVRDEAEATEVRACAVQSIGARSEPWVHDLIEEAYFSGNYRMKLGAVGAMAASCDPAWLPALLDDLDDDDPEMRFEAAMALGSIADEEAAPHLERLMEDDDEDVRLASVAALGGIASTNGDGQALEILRSHLADDDEDLRNWVETAIREALNFNDPFRLELDR